MVIDWWSVRMDTSVDSLVGATDEYGLVITPSARPDASFTIVHDRGCLDVDCGHWSVTAEVIDVGGFYSGRGAAAQCLGMRSSSGGAACTSGGLGGW